MSDKGRVTLLDSPENVGSDEIAARCNECLRTVSANEIRAWAADRTHTWWQWSVFGICGDTHA